MRALRGVGAALAGWIAACAALLSAGASGAGGATALDPGDDFCAAVRGLEPGGELVLAPGDYPAGCAVRRGGAPGAPVIIRAADVSRRPRLVYTGTQSNVLDIRADHVVVRGLRFGPTRADVDGIRIYARQDVAIEDCEFSGIQGIPIVANHVSLRGLAVRRNAILDSRSTAVYIGCHDGLACQIWDVVVENNYVRRTGLGREGVGFGVQIKLNSAAVVRDNVIVHPRGPGIMIYGAQDPRRLAVVEGNLVRGSIQSSGIVIGGGPAMVRNNISVDNADVGLGLEDYGARGLLRDIVIAHNSIASNARGGIAMRAGAVRDVVIANNAVLASASPLPRARPGLVVSGNVGCPAPAACFLDAASLNFSPGPALSSAGIPLSEPWAPRLDFFGFRRGTRPAVGAVERGAGPIPDGLKSTSTPE